MYRYGAGGLFFAAWQGSQKKINTVDLSTQRLNSLLHRFEIFPPDRILEYIAGGMCSFDVVFFKHHDRGHIFLVATGKDQVELQVAKSEDKDPAIAPLGLLLYRMLPLDFSFLPCNFL